MPTAVDQVEEMSSEERDRIDAFLRQIGGPHIVWEPARVLDVWLAEQRIKAERLASRRLALATWEDFVPLPLGRPGFLKLRR